MTQYRVVVTLSAGENIRQAFERLQLENTNYAANGYQVYALPCPSPSFPRRRESMLAGCQK